MSHLADTEGLGLGRGRGRGLGLGLTNPGSWA